SMTRNLDLLGFLDLPPARKSTPRDMVSRAVAYFIPVPGPGERAAEVSRGRLFVVASLFVMAFIILGGRLVQVMLFSTVEDRVITRSDARSAPAYARADIRDRNGI